MALSVPSLCPPQDAHTSPFLLPLSFPPNFFQGSGCRPHPLPFVKGFAACEAALLRGRGAGVPSPLALPLQHRDAPAGDRAWLLSPGIGSSAGTRPWQQRGPRALLPPAPVAAAAGGSGAAAGSPGAGGRAGSPAAGAWCGSISSLCSRSNCSDGDLGQLPSLSRHGNESRRLKDKWLIKKQCCIAGFFIPPTAASAEAVPLARSLSPALGEGAVRQPVPVPKLIMCLINYSHQTTCPRSPLVRSGADGKSDARCPSPGTAGSCCPQLRSPQRC